MNALETAVAQLFSEDGVSICRPMENTENWSLTNVDKQACRRLVSSETHTIPRRGRAPQRTAIRHDRSPDGFRLRRFPGIQFLGDQQLGTKADDVTPCSIARKAIHSLRHSEWERFLLRYSCKSPMAYEAFQNLPP
jgi:hypothetical protein